MRRLVPVLMLGFVCITAAALSAAADMPLWAYGYLVPQPPPGAPAPAAKPRPPIPSDKPVTLPGGSGTYTRAQMMNPYGPVHWFPNEHPPMPEIVAKGRRDANIMACALCHREHGKGQPENAPVNALPVSYFIQQMHDFRSGARKSSDPRKPNALSMIAFAKAMTEAEIKAAAEYFGAIKFTPWTKVIETDTIPKVYPYGNLFEIEVGEGDEPLGKRIIEVPENAERKDIYRDPNSGFIAYVPKGSIKRGETLVKTGGNGKTQPCANCHGADLHGMGPVPGIAGRSASYLIRQMYDMQTGARNSEWAQLMKPVVAKLTNDDFINLGAYITSLK
jgi:cytochrome c553